MYDALSARRMSIFIVCIAGRLIAVVQFGEIGEMWQVVQRKMHF